MADRAFWLRRLEPPHPDTASLLHVRGDILFAMGETHGAQESYVEAVAIAEQTLGTCAPAGGAVSAQGRAHGIRVRRPGSRPDPGERALAVGEAGFAPCHPDLPAFRNDLALSIWNDGDYVAARRMYQRALEQNERCLGKGHSLTTTIVHNLGLLTADMGDRTEAERLQDRAVRDWSASMGRTTPTWRWHSTRWPNPSKRRVGSLIPALCTNGPWRSARARWDRGTRMSPTLASLARIKAKSGDPDGALRDLSTALAMHNRADPSDQPDRVASLLVQKGEIERALGDYSSARVSYAEAQATRVRISGESHPLAADTDARLAAVDFALGDRSRAMQEALRAEDIGRNHLRFLVRYLPERQGLADSANAPAASTSRCQWSRTGRPVPPVFSTV